MAKNLDVVLSAFASIFTVTIAYVVFGPLINSNLQSIILDSLAEPGGMLQAAQISSFLLTVNIIIIGVKVFAWFTMFAVLVWMFLHLGFKTEEQGVY